MAGDLQRAVYSEAIGNSALSTAVTQTGKQLTQGIFYQTAPEDAAMPYVVFNIISQTPIHDFDDTLEDVLVQFSVFDNSEGIATVEDVKDKLLTTFDRASLTFAAKSDIGCLRVAQTGPDRIEDGWMSTVDYEIWYK